MTTVAQLAAQVQQLRQEIRQLQGQLVAVENARVIPPYTVQFARIAGIVEEGYPLQRRYTTRVQEVDPLGAVQKVDAGPEVHHVQQLDKDGRLQSYSQDVIVLAFQHFRVMCPVPSRLVPVRDSGEGEPFGRLGRWVDVTPDGPADAEGLSEPLPMLNANDITAFVEGIPPYKVDSVYPGIHVWPLPESPIEGVDPDKGFFIVWTMPPGDLAKTYSSTVELESGESLKHEVKVDGQGNVLDVKFELLGPYYGGSS